MKRLLSSLLILAALGGCAVVPLPGAYVPPGVVYVAPTYPAPGPGYLWDFNVGVGWGWWHPTHGWHRR